MGARWPVEPTPPFEISSLWTRLGAVGLLLFLGAGWGALFALLGPVAAWGAVLAIPTAVLYIHDMCTRRWVRFDDGVLELPGWFGGIGRTRTPLRDVVSVESHQVLRVIARGRALPISGTAFVSLERRAALRDLILAEALRAGGAADSELATGPPLGVLHHDCLEFELGRNRQGLVAGGALILAGVAVGFALSGHQGLGTMAVLWVFGGLAIRSGTQSRMLAIDAAGVHLRGQWSERLVDVQQVLQPLLGGGAIIELRLRSGGRRRITVATGDPEAPARLLQALREAVAGAVEPPPAPPAPEELEALARQARAHRTSE